MIKILSLIGLILGGVVIGYIISSKNLISPGLLMQPVATSQPHGQNNYPTQTIGELTPAATPGWKTYISKADNIKFDYPSIWRLSIKKGPNLTDNPEPEDFTLTTEDASYHNFEMNLVMSANGVGGACPDFDPDKLIVSSKKMDILNQPTYLIYLGDKAANKVNHAYISDQPDGVCPNVAFVQIKGLPGLFAANYGYKDDGGKPLQMDSGILLNDSNIIQAETILQSIRFNN